MLFFQLSDAFVTFSYQMYSENYVRDWELSVTCIFYDALKNFASVLQTQFFEAAFDILKPCDGVALIYGIATYNVA